MSSSKLLFAPVPYSLKQIKLATLLSDLYHPDQKQGPTMPTTPGVDYEDDRTVYDWESTLQSGKSSSFWAQITRLLKIRHGASSSDYLHLKAKRGRIYQLRDPAALFKKFWKDEKVQEYLKGAVERDDPVYFLVGFRTFIDANVDMGDAKTRKVQAESRVPAREIIQGNTGVNVGDAADVGAGVDNSSGGQSQHLYRVEEECVYSIVYRTVILTELEPGSHPELSEKDICRMFTDAVKGAALQQYDDYKVDLDNADVVPLHFEEEDDPEQDTVPVRYSDRITSVAGDEYYVLVHMATGEK
ncbi:hypothetical protein BBP40_010007 [Aspergillus hancockii]|nr:hypothetical protein BBP40_010007 [Aspergillus hancockii]